MSIFEISIKQWDFNRDLTLALLKDVESLEDPQTVLAWQAAPKRAHIAWQLTHVAVTEELFATSRLLGTTPACPDLVERFQRGSAPNENILSIKELRELLASSRQHLKETISTFGEDDLSVIPESFRERGWTLETILKIVAWHEPHHQGQAHSTLNLWKASQS